MAENSNDLRKAQPAESVLRMTADIVTAYVGKNNLSPNQFPELIRTVYQSLTGAGGGMPAPISSENQKPAVSIKKSITDEFIICLEDGKKLKMLKRHLRTVYGMSPEQYRSKWGLPADYPMVAPKYAAQRSMFAKKIGLGKGAGGRTGRSKRAA